MIGRLLCLIGFHCWDQHTVVDVDWVSDYAWCQRRGCRYETPILVNREPR